MVSNDKQKSTDGLSKKRVLLVEDDVFLGDIIARKLVAQGCIFLYAQDGEKALPLAEQEMPDIILLDILLPGINGFDLLEKFKANPKTKNIPVIILSNLNQSSDFEKGKNLKAARFLIKATTSTEEILLKLKEVLEETKKS
jgi:CheY-like chemotaxis protein